MFNLFKSNKKEKLYKFVFYRSSGYSWEKNNSSTLLIAANSTTEAVKKFYELVNNNVSTITEFTEIKYAEPEECCTKGDNNT